MKVYLYILVAGLVSTLIRVLPATLIRKKIENKFIKSFLYYLPYVTLAVMTFPAIMQCTEHPLAGLLAMLVGMVVAWFGGNLFVVSIVCCIIVFIVERMI